VPALPEYRRALALAYLKTSQLPQAERELRDGITNAPAHAAFWTDLALVFNAQAAANRRWRPRKTVSSGHIDLDNESLTVLAGCPLQPAVADGKPVPAWSMLQYVWQIE
jgi:hypothetical protein